MCKILAFSGITDATSELAWKFAEKMAKEMSFSNNHGLGYGAIDAEGKLFGERWHVNEDAFKLRSARMPIDEMCIRKYKGMFDKPIKYNRFGTLNQAHTRSIILHARMATSGKEFYNTHPFVDKDTQTCLIHNGVINNAEKIGIHISTCDSEAIMNSYIIHDVMNTPENIKKVDNDLEGYFACGVFSMMADGTPILDIFRDSRASLNAAYIEELETVVFTTADMDINTTCRELNLTISTKFEVAHHRMLRMNAVTGDVIGTYDFKNEKKSHGRQHYTRADTTNSGYGRHNNYGYGSHYDTSGHEDVVSTEQKRLTEVDKTNAKVVQMDDWEHNKETGLWMQIKNGGSK